jgi:hypothetical protein
MAIAKEVIAVIQVQYCQLPIPANTDDKCPIPNTKIGLVLPSTHPSTNWDAHASTTASFNLKTSVSVHKTDI